MDLLARTVVLAAGTFLRGRVLMGEAAYEAGRAGEPPSIGLADCLRRLGFRLDRLKTGTPPRVHRRSVDVTGLERQSTSDVPLAFSFWSEPRALLDDHPVYVTRTNAETHRIIRASLQRSVIFNGLMTGAGPRHCPSLESKIVKFPERDQHKVFLEPEGRDSAEVYLQGVYTAFAPEVQERIVHSIEGLEGAHIERYGYNIEYDFVDPLHLQATLETHEIRGLYLCGQVVGTTGYEEAAAQGLLAGINAARTVRGIGTLVLSRGEAVIGVLVDDLVTKGVSEPYRMLPSRCEHRVALREQNADLRLSGRGHALGLLPDARYERVTRKEQAVFALVQKLTDTRIGPHDPINERLAPRGTRPLQANGAILFELLARPPLRLEDLMDLDGIDEAVREEVEIRGKYAGYLAQHERELTRLARLDDLLVPADLNYAELRGISFEGRHLLERVRPQSFGQATRVPGVSHADLAMLAIYIRRGGSSELRAARSAPS